MEAYYDVKAPGNNGEKYALYCLMKQKEKNVTRSKWSTGWQSKRRTACTSHLEDVSLDEKFIL